METIGILGGSFNPVHIGHMMVASYLAQYTPLDAVWLTLSPLNPLKSRPEELIPDLQRLAMLRLAINGTRGLGVCDLELSLPRPSYTINTLHALKQRYRNKRFRLIVGSDNWRIFNQWRQGDEILESFGVIVYPRPGYPIDNRLVDGMEVANAPMVDLSSTFIRRGIARGYNMNFFLPPGVNEYISQHQLYQSTRK